jgi:hypothetical protein
MRRSESSSSRQAVLKSTSPALNTIAASALLQKGQTGTLMILMAEPLTDNMRALGKECLLGFRMKLWRNADEVQFGLIPPVVFLPDVTIKEILDNYALLHSIEDLDPIIKNHRYCTISINSSPRPDFQKI